MKIIISALSCFLTFLSCASAYNDESSQNVFLRVLNEGYGSIGRGSHGSGSSGSGSGSSSGSGSRGSGSKGGNFHNFTMPETCGNGICEEGESCLNCEDDCIRGTSGGSECGNGVCEDGEHCYTCPEDCNLELEEDGAEKFCCFGGPKDPQVPFAVGCDEDIRCGAMNGKCSGEASPLVMYCCGDGVCNGDEEHNTCPIDGCESLCGNGKCDLEEGENADTCAMDCPCNLDGYCGPWETLKSCPVDCTCGNFKCDHLLGESIKTCPSDCGCNANHHCEPWEDSSCEMDNCYGPEDDDDEAYEGSDDVVCKASGEPCAEHSHCCSFTCDLYAKNKKPICVG